MLAQGDLKLLALALIAEQPRHGYELIKLIEDKTRGAYSPSPGVVYPTLTFLEEAGYVTAESRRRQEALHHHRRRAAPISRRIATSPTWCWRGSQPSARSSRACAASGKSGDGEEDSALPKLVDAALENLREVAVKRLETEAKRRRRNPHRRDPDARRSATSAGARPQKSFTPRRFCRQG